MIGQAHRRARLPLRPAGLAAGALPQRLRGRLARPVRRRRPGGVLRVLLHPGGQVSHLSPQLLHLFPQLADLGHLQPEFRDQLIAFCQQLPQPRVRGPQPGSQLSQSGHLTRHTGRIGHMPHFTTAGPPSSARHAERPATIAGNARPPGKRDPSSYGLGRYGRNTGPSWLRLAALRLVPVAARAFRSVRKRPHRRVMMSG